MSISFSFRACLRTNQQAAASKQQAEAATAEQQAGKQLGRFQFYFDCGRVRLSASLRRANRVPLKAHQAQLLLQDASKREKA